MLGALLEEWRRVTLGHVYRTTFARERLPLTPDGNPNTRRVDDLESNRRPNRWPAGTLKEMAAAYGVTYDSMLAVLAGKADELAPAEAPRAVPASLAPPPAGISSDPPAWPPARVAADRPWFDPINERRVELAARGIAYPTGAQMFGEGTDDAKAWDEEGAPLPVGDRVWMIADLRRRAAGRSNPGTGTGTAGA